MAGAGPASAPADYRAAQRLWRAAHRSRGWSNARTACSPSSPRSASRSLATASNVSRSLATASNVSSSTEEDFAAGMPTGRCDGLIRQEPRSGVRAARHDKQRRVGRQLFDCPLPCLGSGSGPSVELADEAGGETGGDLLAAFVGSVVVGVVVHVLVLESGLVPWHAPRLACHITRTLPAVQLCGRVAQTVTTSTRSSSPSKSSALRV